MPPRHKLDPHKPHSVTDGQMPPPSDDPTEQLPVLFTVDKDLINSKAGVHRRPDDQQERRSGRRRIYRRTSATVLALAFIGLVIFGAQNTEDADTTQTSASSRLPSATAPAAVPSVEATESPAPADDQAPKQDAPSQDSSTAHPGDSTAQPAKITKWQIQANGQGLIWIANQISAHGPPVTAEQLYSWNITMIGPDWNHIEAGDTLVLHVNT